jgi:SAM-dependent methyltransferase
MTELESPPMSDVVAPVAAHWCPVCQQDVQAWMPGPGGRLNEECPHCRSLKRNRLLVLTFDRLQPIFETAEVVLDVAPTPGVEARLRELIDEDSYISFDLGLDPRPVKVKGDLTRIPLRDDSVDVLVSFHVLEHVPDDRAAMREIARVIGRHGIAVLQVPWDRDRLTDEDPSADRDERIRRFGRHDHVRQYGSDFEDRLREAGLAIARFTAGVQFSADVRKRTNINSLLWLATGVPGDPTSAQDMIDAVLSRRAARPTQEETLESLRRQRDAYRVRLRERERELRRMRRQRNAAQDAEMAIRRGWSYRLSRLALAPARWVRRLAPRR